MARANVQIGFGLEAAISGACKQELFEAIKTVKNTIAWNKQGSDASVASQISD